MARRCPITNETTTALKTRPVKYFYSPKGFDDSFYKNVFHGAKNATHVRGPSRRPQSDDAYARVINQKKKQ